MKLTKDEEKAAIRYNRRRGYDDRLITKIQRLIDTRPDGIIGPKTVQAVAVWQDTYNLDKIDGKIGPNTIRAMDEQLCDDEDGPKPLSFSVHPDPDLEPFVQDRTEQGRIALEAKSEDQNRPFQGEKRDSNKIDGVVLHQMGFSRGNPIHKYDKVTAHFIVTPAGEIANLHPFSASLYSSSALNPKTVAVEFAGNFRDENGKFWNVFPPNYLTPQQVTAGRFLLGYLNDEHKIEKVYAHRQGAGGRRANCCGPEIWKYIAEDALEYLDYYDTRDQTFRAGASIPSSWRL